MTQSGYFYPHQKQVIFHRVLNGGWADTYTVIYDCDSPDDAYQLALALNRDLEQIDHLSRATAESYPGRSSVFF